MSDGRILLERDDERGIARLTLSNPERKNAYDPAMRRQLVEVLVELAYDDTTKVVVLRGEGGVFSTGADMNNAYAWYGDGAKPGANGNANASASANMLNSPAATSSQGCQPGSSMCCSRRVIPCSPST